MKLTILVTLFLTVFLSSMPAFAGGIICRSCPGESIHCIPRPGCKAAASESIFETIAKMYDSEEGLCPASSASECKGKAVGATCGTLVNEKGSCELTGLTAGRFCKCN